VRMKVTQHSGDYIDQQLSSSGPPWTCRHRRHL